MSHAEVCPVCKGTGTKTIGPLESASGTVEVQTCPGCDGRCWVTVGTEYPPIGPCQPMYSTYSPPYRWEWSPWGPSITGGQMEILCSGDGIFGPSIQDGMKLR